MFAIHFTTEDLARTRIAVSYGPYAEALFSLGVLADRRGRDALFDGWRQPLSQHPNGWRHRLDPIIDGGVPMLDLFTLIGPVTTADEGRHNLLAIGRHHLRAETDAAGHWAAARGRAAMAAIPRWVFRLHDDGQARAGLVSLLNACNNEGVAPYWVHIRAHLEAEAALRRRLLGQQGLRRLLNSLHPHLRWDGGVLQVSQRSHTTAQVATQIFPAGDVDVDADASHVHLNGRGLTLVPSVFCRRITPYVSVAEPDGPVVLFYPALRDITDAYRLWSQSQPTSTRRALIALLGTTRATALETLTDPCTTTELARRLRVSPATASHHASVLREARLTTTRRQGSAVLHSITPLGLDLVNGQSTT